MHRQGIKKKHKILQMWKLHPRATNCNYDQVKINNADAVKISYYAERLEIRPKTPNNRSLF